MNNTKFHRTHWLKSFRVFVAHFFHICFVLRGVLGVQLILVACGGLAVSRCEEDISAWEGVYFAIITATSVGYGDIAPETAMGQLTSVALALIGTIFFGLVVAAATKAVEVTVRDYRSTHQGSPDDPIDNP
jgi:voltage-gated potassium channel